MISESKSLQDCKEQASELQQKIGACLISPSDHPDVILGHGTVALEASDQLEEMGEGSFDAFIVPCGGGGLLTGSAIFYKDSETKVFGTEPELGGSYLAKSIRIGKRIERDWSFSTIADGLRSPIGANNWRILRDQCYVEGAFTVSESQIRSALFQISVMTGMIVEPSPAVPIACLLYNSQIMEIIGQRRRRYTVGIVLSGGNTTKTKFSQLVRFSHVPVEQSVKK